MHEGDRSIFDSGLHGVAATSCRRCWNTLLVGSGRRMLDRQREDRSVGLSIGGGIGPLRGRVGSRSASIGVGPISMSTGYGRRTRHADPAGDLEALVWLVAAPFAAGSRGLKRRRARKQARLDFAESLLEEVRGIDDLLSHIYGYRQPAPGAAVLRGHRLLYTMDDVWLAERRSVQRGGPKAYVGVEAGRLLLTDQAVHWQGAGRRRLWKWDQLTDARCDDRGAILLDVESRQNVSGVLAESRAMDNVILMAIVWVLTIHEGESCSDTAQSILHRRQNLIETLPGARRDAKLSPQTVPPPPAPNRPHNGLASRQEPVAPTQSADVGRAPAPSGSTTVRSGQPDDTPAATPNPASKGPRVSPEPATWFEDVRHDWEDVTDAQLTHLLLDIVDQEGPVTVGRLRRTAAGACRVKRVGSSVRQRLDALIGDLVERGAVEATDLGAAEDVATVFLPGQPSTPDRGLGPRRLDEVPLTELAGLAGGRTGEDAARHIQRSLGLSRLSASARERILWSIDT